MNDYTFGNFLYSLRTEKGLSQSQLGQLLGVTNKAVSKWENGSAKPNTVLIPRLAEIFGVTVEELFACKKFEKDCEYEKIKNLLSLQKKKYAILSSFFLSAAITLPLLLIEFICIVLGFNFPDEIIGPIGSICFILALIISVTAFIIYQKNFKQSITPSKFEYTAQFTHLIKTGILISTFLCCSIFVLLPLVYLLFLSYFQSPTFANIFLSVGAFIFIILFGIIICFSNIKRLLKIKFYQQSQKKKIRIEFSKLPIWAKICYIAVIVLYPIVLIIRIFGINNTWIIIRFTLYAVWLGCMLALNIYSVKKK